MGINFAIRRPSAWFTRDFSHRQQWRTLVRVGSKDVGWFYYLTYESGRIFGTAPAPKSRSDGYSFIFALWSRYKSWGIWWSRRNEELRGVNQWGGMWCGEITEQADSYSLSKNAWKNWGLLCKTLVLSAQNKPAKSNAAKITFTWKVLYLIILNNFKLISRFVPVVLEKIYGRYGLGAVEMAIFSFYLTSTELVIVAIYEATGYAFRPFWCSTKTWIPPIFGGLCLRGTIGTRF